MNELLTKSNLFFKRNSSTILTCVGAVGVVATSVLAVKATPKAMRLLEQAKEEKGEELTKTESAIVAGPVYIPAAAVGLSTIACIFGANVINKRHQASLMSLYAFADNSYKEYRKKFVELYGEDAEKEVRHEIVKDKYEVSDISIEDDNQKLFFNYHTMQYFYSTMEEVLQAENRFNKNFALSGYISLNEFCDILGTPRVDYGYELGWSMEAGGAFYNYTWVDFEHENVAMEDGLECCIISTSQEPTIDYLGF